MNKKENKFIAWIKSIPWYGWLFGFLMLGLQTAIYYLGHWLSSTYTCNWYFVDPRINGIDDKIPLIPQFFVQMYSFWFVFFPLGAILCSIKNRKNYINLLIAWIATILLGGVLFIFVPSRIDRLDMPGIPGNNMYEYVIGKKGFSWWWFTAFFNPSTPRYGWCEFPSFHCVCIIFPFIGFLDKKQTRPIWKILWFIICLCICLSTVFIKSHMFLDIIIAMLICTLSYLLVRIFDPAAKILEKKPNFFIIKKLNWNNETVVSISKSNKRDVKIKKAD